MFLVRQAEKFTTTMIVVRLTGGLGNQMFQYAAARRLAHVTGQQLKLDCHWFSWQSPEKTPRNYELGVFDLKVEVATAAESRRLRGLDTSRWPKVLRHLLDVAGHKAPASYVKELKFKFEPNIRYLNGDTYLDGYWQSEKYFIDAEQIIRSDFRMKTEPQGKNANVLAEIRSCESVSIHFRRGDYVTNLQNAARHGILPLGYYQDALDILRRQIHQPHLFVFSDDLQWVKKNLKTDLPLLFVEGNGPDKSAEDLRLMSACRHHIIANSSFSWWGAWLGSNADKIVLTPQAWFFDQQQDTSDLIPSEWLRV